MSFLARAIAVIVCFCFAPVAQSYWQSRDSNYNIAISSGYVGPGDLTTFSAWWGLRAYSAAKRGTAAANVCDAADAHCGDLSTNATSGTITSFVMSGGSGVDCSAVACTIKTLYDQTGNGNDVTQATINIRPKLLINSASCPSLSLPCGFWDTTATAPRLRGTITTVNQPFSISTVAKRTGNNTLFGPIVTGSGFGVYFDHAVNQAIIYAGTLSSAVAAADGSFHALNGTFNGASSALMVDGSDTTGLSTGAGSFANPTSFGDEGTTALTLTGISTEGGVFSGGSNATRSALNSNQRTYWGF